jgi:hypothetical protein
MSDTESSRNTPTGSRCQDQDNSLTVDEVCELLASERRRILLQYLISHPDEPVHVDDLVDYLIARGATDERDTIAIRLHHIHLPKVADAGVLSYTPTTGHVHYHRHHDLEEHLIATESDSTSG